MTKDDEIDFQTSTCCYICKNDLNNDKARDHDHFTGKYRGAAHNQCNLNIRKTRYRIPIIIHNMKGYDSHLFVKKLDKLNKIAIIAKSMEKYIKIKGEINGLPVIFIDSNQFLALSLESLVKTFNLVILNILINTLTKIVIYLERKVYTLMITWIPGINLIRRIYLRWRISTIL